MLPFPATRTTKPNQTQETEILGSAKEGNRIRTLPCHCQYRTCDGRRRPISSLRRRPGRPPLAGGRRLDAASDSWPSSRPPGCYAGEAAATDDRPPRGPRALLVAGGGARPWSRPREHVGAAGRRARWNGNVAGFGGRRGRWSSIYTDGTDRTDTASIGRGWVYERTNVGVCVMPTWRRVRTSLRQTDMGTCEMQTSAFV